MEIEKGPGWDWSITYEDEDGVTDVMDVFGVMTIEEAVAEARYSLNALVPFAGAIIKVERR